ncbi:MAG: trimethylamine methyltransferase family protein, partial [Halieaceae bacterium]|nr:trimethylamine methyltransferase family protein [Halieaceae bacterium]
APREFTQHARNPERNVIIGGDRTVLVPAYGSPFVYDLDQGRRYATLADFENFVKLAYVAPGMHHSGGTVCEPVDLPVNKRHFDMIYSHIKYSDKPFMGSVTEPGRAQDTIDMARIVFGEEFVRNNCVCISLINANSPLTFDATMLGAAKIYAAHNQATVISPFILAGAMSPVTVVGTATQILAEALAGMAFVQLVKPGAPVVFGSFACAISMQSGAPTFGTPEPSMVMYMVAALARRLGVPFRSGGGLCGSKIPDAQAAYESANTLQSAAMAGVNFMLHTAGWLEGGLSMGYEKFVMDCDQANMIAVLLAGADTTDNGQALDALREVGPGAHFLGAEHTQANFETAFYRSTVADNNSYEQWQAEGELDCAQRANGQWKQMLNDYQAPPIDPAVDEALQEFINKRKLSFPDKDY